MDDKIHRKELVFFRRRRMLPFFRLVNATYAFVLLLTLWVEVRRMRSVDRKRFWILGASLLILVFTLKWAFGVERPDRSNFMSFPSGHAAVASFLATVAALPPRTSCVWPLVVGWAVLASAARVVTRRHYLDDVLAGASFGVLFGVAVRWSPQRRRFRTLRP